MKRGLSGRFEAASPGIEPVRAFVPATLPPDPALVISPGLREEMDQALLALGRLDAGVVSQLPDTSLFLYAYVRKEAVLSSQIEGTQSSLSDLLLFEIEELPGAPFDDVREVSNYVRALEHGVKRVRGGFPISNRLFCELHSKLLAKGRGSRKQPGEFRTSQNRIGGKRPGVATFVPPPPEKVHDCMAALERFIHDQPERTSPILKAALAHVQFETIHPFLDGNGRLGRLLITLLLVAEGILKEPLLYLSLYLKRHRKEYYELLQTVRTEGDWESWVDFFVRGVRETAEEAVSTARRLARVFAEDHARVQKLGRVAGSALRVHHALQHHPIQTIKSLADRTELTVPTVTSALAHLVDAGIVREITGRPRSRVFAYDRYVRLLSEGATPINPA